MERVRNDEDFKKELEGMFSVKERTEFIKAEGFDFTRVEIDSLKQALSDDKLQAVSSGQGKINCNIYRDGGLLGHG